MSTRQIVQKAAFGAPAKSGRRIRLADLDAELEVARVRLAEMDALEVQRNLLVKHVAELKASKERGPAGEESHSDIVMRSVSFRLGNAIIQAGQSWHGLLSLPKKLAALRRETERKKQSNGKHQVAEMTWLIEQVLARCPGEQYMSALSWLVRQEISRKLQSQVTMHVARDVRARSCELAYRMTIEALKLDSSNARARALAFTLFDAGHVAKPQEILANADLRDLNGGELNRVRQIRSMTMDLPIPRRSNVAAAAEPKSAIICCNNSTPYHLTGQTLRDHLTVDALTRNGWSVAVVTEPGYPHTKEQGDTVVEITGQTRFIRLPAVDTPVGDYAAISAGAAEGIAHAVTVHRPEAIISTGDFVMARAALAVARRFGVRFILDLGEIRPPWAPALCDEESAERSNFLIRQMAKVAAQSDCVIVRNRALGDALCELGLPAEAVQVVDDPAIPSEDVVSIEELRGQLGIAGRVVIGHVGHVAPHRGAVKMLERLSPIRELSGSSALLLVGPVQHRERVMEAFASSWPDGALAMPGRVRPEQYSTYAKLIDIWIESPATSRAGALTAPIEIDVALRGGAHVVAPDTQTYRNRLGGVANVEFYAAESVHGLAEAVARAHAGRTANRPTTAEPAPASRSLEEWGRAYQNVALR